MKKNLTLQKALKEKNIKKLGQMEIHMVYSLQKTIQKKDQAI